MGDTLTDTTASRFGPIIALIGVGHAASHFAFLTVQPLFPLLKAEFDVSYAALGLIMTAMSVASAKSRPAFWSTASAPGRCWWWAWR